jgi:hypothetical protein
MANTVLVTTYRESVSDVLYNQLSQFYSRFLEEHRKVLQDNRLLPKVTVFGQPHDTIIAVDTKSVIIIASKGTSTDSTSTDRYFDFSSRGTVTPQELMRAAAREMGWQSMMPLSFNKSLLDAPEDYQREEFRRVSEKMVDDVRQKQRVANALGITEALTYLENARIRYEAGGSTGFSDCKANCRNAIASLMRGLSGTDKVRDAVKKLHQQGLLGERETEVVEAIADLITKLYGLASKTGTHPPLATEDDAHFTLRITEAVVEYIVRIVAKAKGL